MKSTNPFADAPATEPLPIPVLCTCVHFLSEECLVKRWQIGMDLAIILHGCKCRCHIASNGAYMPAGAWAANREQKRREIERIKSLNEIRVRQANGRTKGNSNAEA